MIFFFTNLQITTTFHHSLFFFRLNTFISFTCSLNDVISRHIVLIIAFQSFENTLLRTAHSIRVVACPLQRSYTEVVLAACFLTASLHLNSLSFLVR